jgi:hypothetical protein
MGVEIPTIHLAPPFEKKEPPAMPEVAQPRKPEANWEHERDEWVAAVEQLVADVETWAPRHNWWVHRDQKTITEEPIGSYTAPLLRIQTPQGGRLILDPIARDVIGGEGLVELCVFPSYDYMNIVRTDEGWSFKSSLQEDFHRPWSEEAFLEVAAQLIAKA